MAEDWRALNRALWDERVPIHVGSRFYDVEGFLTGRTSLRGFELKELGDVEGRTLVHLQCHFGQDTLSWARRGARVSGLDFSRPAVEAARELAARAGLKADFVEGDVYDAAERLGGRRFDVVYTGLGALNWLPDLTGWAQVVAGLLEPAGHLYLAEFHPVTEVFGDDDLAIVRGYFDPEARKWDEPGTYTDLDAPTVHNRSVEWTHGVGQVVSAVLDAGLRLELLHEHPDTLFPRWPFLETRPDSPDVYRMPAGMPSLPLMYSLRARKPG